MANKIADIIRRIVGFDPSQSSLAQSIRRTPIMGMTGIGYMTADKATAGSTSGGPNKKLPKENSEDGWIKDANYIDLPAYLTGGNRVDATDPDKSRYGGRDGVLLPENYINIPALVTTTIKDSDRLVTGIGPLTSSAQGGGTMNGMEGITDCATGKKMNIRFDGRFVPPPGWANAETPPGDGPAEHWELGTSWFAPGFPAGYTANNPLDAAEAAKNATFPLYTLLVSTTLDPAFPHAGGVRRYIYVWEKFADPLHDQVSFYAQDQTCTPVDGDLICPTTNPATPQYWPVDDELQLARGVDGRLRFSQFEPPADRIAAYEDNTHTTIKFCFSGGSRQGEIETTNDGGYMVYEKIAGVPTGIIKKFNMANQIEGYADVAGAQAWRIAPEPTQP